MTNIDYSLTIRFDGNDADSHEIDLFSLGESLKGMARIAAVVGNFALHQKYSKNFNTHELKVVAKEPVANCFSLTIFWSWMQQQQILSGSFGILVGILIQYVFAKNASNIEEMKLLKDSLDKTIHLLGNKDESVVLRLLALVEKMADDLRPAVKQSVYPIGQTCTTMTLKDNMMSKTIDEKEKNRINKSNDNELTELKDFTILATELDLEKGTCKIHIDGDTAEKRISASISDPAFLSLNNAYSMAFASGEKLNVKAKALIKDGEIEKLFIFDT